MGKFLLDGRNPQTWHEALALFKDLDFGEMNLRCKRTMLEYVSEGAPAKYEEGFIHDIAMRLMVELGIRELDNDSDTI